MLVGRVSSVSSTFEGRFSVLPSTLSAEDKPIALDVAVDEWFPVMVGDMVFGFIDTSSLPFHFLSSPAILIGNDYDTVRSAIKTALKNTQKADAVVQWLSTSDGISKDGIGGSLDVIANTWNLTRTNSGLGGVISGVNKLLGWWCRNRLLRQLYMFGLTKTQINEIGRDYIAIRRRILTNPYAIPEIPIELADNIVARYKITAEVDDRQLGEKLRICYDIQKSFGMAWMIQDFVGPHLDKLVQRYNIVKNDSKKLLTFKSVFDIEVGVSNWILNMLRTPPIPIIVFKWFDDNLSQEQKNAVRLSLSNKIFVITGPAGTGKTTVIHELTRQLSYRHIEYVVVSFTGRAVARVREVVKCGVYRAITIHRLLAIEQRPNFQHLIIDEASMVTTSLFYDLITSFCHDFSVTLVGDDNQLEPIGWGLMFRQILSSAIIPTVRLVSNFRSTDLVLHNALRLLQYKDSLRTALVGSIFPDFEFEISEKFCIIPSAEFIRVDILIDYLLKFVNIKDILVVTPFIYAAAQINNSVQQKLFPQGSAAVVDRDGRKWNVGDRVVMLENNYEINVMHGEIGIVSEIREPVLKVQFGEQSIQNNNTRIAEMFLRDPPKTEDGANNLSTRMINLAYAFTVHSVQGGEADHVIAYIPPSQRDFITNNMLYTIVTRARQAIWMVAAPQTISKAARIVTPDKLDQLAFELSAANSTKILI